MRADAGHSIIRRTSSSFRTQLLVKSERNERAAARSGPPPWMSPYLVACLILAASASVVWAQTQTVSEVQVTPETMTLGAGQKQALFATAFDGRGNLIASAKFSFWSSDTLIARVTKEGTVLGITPGLAKIEARSQGRRASMAVLITGSAPGDSIRTHPTAAAAPALTLTLSPASVSLFPGEATRIAARATRADGSPLALGRLIWRSLQPEIASADTSGLVAGLGSGRTTVQVYAGNRLLATLPVEVSQRDFVLSRSTFVLGPDEVDTVRAVVPSQGNREIRSLVQWHSTDSSVVTVSSSGIVKAQLPGRAEIVATGFSQERRAAVVVHQVPDALVVSPHHSAGPVQVPLRSTRKFTAVAEAVDSTPIPEARISWALGDTAIATFDPSSGILTPKTLGTTTLTARLVGIQPAIWTVQVTSGEIGIDPGRLGLAPGQRITVAAFLKDEQGTPVGRASGVRWSSDRPDIALAREGGVIDALSAGHAVVTTTAPWGKSAKADVFIAGDLLLSSNRDGKFGIYQIRTGGPLSLLPLLRDSATNIQAALSPDRTRIAFSSNRSGNFDLYVMDADGVNPKRLTTDSGNEGDPAWTPDGKWIVHSMTRGSVPQVAMVSAEGGETRQLTTTAKGNHSPAVSPDGRTIAFVSARDGNQELYLMEADGSNQRRLTKTSVRESSPRFFRNGDLGYVVERGSGSRGSKVMRLPLSGAGVPVQILQTEEPISSLAVSRDGDRLAYVVGKIADAANGRVDFGLFLQSTAPGGLPTSLPLRPGEQILSPAF